MDPSYSMIHALLKMVRHIYINMAARDPDTMVVGWALLHSHKADSNPCADT